MHHPHRGSRHSVNLIEMGTSIGLGIECGIASIYEFISTYSSLSSSIDRPIFPCGLALTPYSASFNCVALPAVFTPGLTELFGELNFR